MHIIDVPPSMSIERDQPCDIAFQLFLRRGRNSGETCLDNLRVEETRFRLSAQMTEFNQERALTLA